LVAVLLLSHGGRLILACSNPTLTPWEMGVGTLTTSSTHLGACQQVGKQPPPPPQEAPTLLRHPGALCCRHQAQRCERRVCPVGRQDRAPVPAAL
jgi:hypothetical protein